MLNEQANDFALVVSSCDLYEDAWNPFFRLLQVNWPECPKKIYLLTETKKYTDPYFNIECIVCNNTIWSNRMKFALTQIKEKYIWFFLEDFFLESKVDSNIVNCANKCIMRDDVGVIKFIPQISSNWYDENHTYSSFFSLIPKCSKSRSNLMLSLYKKDYFKKLLRKNETPWDFERFGSYRSRKYNEEVLVQNDAKGLAFPYNYQIKYGYGITKRKWLKNNKLLFDSYGINVNYDNLGWYEGKTPKIVGCHRTLKQKFMLIFTEPKTFFRIIYIEIKEKLYVLMHLRNYF